MYKENINFNPLCDSISKANFYFAPSVAVNRDLISALCRARKVEGFVDVEKVKFDSESILVGNLKNPKNIVFSHFDSIGPGAIDNASGTAICIKLILENKNISAMKKIIITLLEKGSSPKEVVEQQGISVISDENTIRDMVKKVLAENEEQVQRYKSGKPQLLGFFIGQVMKETKGRAQPETVNKIVKEELDK